MFHRDAMWIEVRGASAALTVRGRISPVIQSWLNPPMDPESRQSRDERERASKTRNKHENHFDLPLLNIHSALFHIIQIVYRL